MGGHREQAVAHVPSFSRRKSIDFSILSPSDILHISKAEVSAF
jgi:DNA-directed RNA polymerase III subunit RPC1